MCNFAVQQIEKKGWRGLGLSEDFSALNLLKGDRLEPHSGCMDTASFFSLSEFPARVLFWRTKSEVTVRHRNPILSEATGILPERSCALDWLHVLSLGVFQSYLSVTLQSLIDCDAWETRETNRPARVVLSVARMSADIETWQQAQERLGRQVTRIGIVSAEQLGSKTKPKCDFKGADELAA